MQVNDTKTVLSWKYKLKQSKRIFGDLCKTLSELNKVFSLPSLVFLTLRLISSAFSLYVTIYGSLRTDNAFIQALAPACAVSFTTGFLSILVVLKGIETPILEFKHLRQKIFSILNEEPDIQMDDEFEVRISKSGSHLYIFLKINVAQLLPSRWIALHHRRLTNAVEAIQRVERLLGEEFITEHASSIPIRFVVGFAAVLMTSTGLLVVTMPMYAMLLPPAFGIFSTIVLFVASASINITTDKIELMKINALTFDYLCRASSELNSVFSIPVFYILAIKFVTVVSTAFGYAYRFIHTNDILDNAFLIYPFLIVTESIRILILFTSTDMPVNQVRLLHERVSALSLSGFSKTMAEKITMMTLLTQIDEDRIHLSAAGLFKVGVHLIPALSGAVVTYMVILLQN
ncbi:hypothetical protein OUZ56_001028 [Daphnia magna]|uniref:Gustatory receptor n=1 Tax=Daphnia magna TaxID=35525 RepID=A0ABR0A1F3_9CRUS|nr:hypothetical protein OUZ56_001028 [Daphnia magna]